MIINAILIGSLAAITAVVVAIFATTLNKAKNGKRTALWVKKNKQDGGKQKWKKIFSKLKRAFYYEVDVILAAKHLHNEYHFFPGIAYRNFTKDDISIFSSGFSDLTTLYNESADQYTGLVCELYGKPACCIWYTDKTKENVEVYDVVLI